MYKEERAMVELFRNYSRAFDSLNASRIAALYTLPCSTSDGDGLKVFVDEESLANKFEENCSAMKVMGYRSSEFNILSEINMGEFVTAVNVGWRVGTEKGEIEFRSMYVCHKENDSWLIFSANVYDGTFNAI